MKLIYVIIIFLSIPAIFLCCMAFSSKNYVPQGSRVCNEAYGTETSRCIEIIRKKLLCNKVESYAQTLYSSTSTLRFF